MFRQLSDKDRIISYGEVNNWVLIWTMVKVIVPELVFFCFSLTASAQIGSAGAMVGAFFWLIIFAVIDVLIYIQLKRRKMMYSYSNYYVTIGLLKSRDMVIPLDQITAVMVDSGIFGKIFNYGTITVLAPGAHASYMGVNTPYDFSISLMEQIEKRKQDVRENVDALAAPAREPVASPAQRPMQAAYQQAKYGSVNCIAGAYVGASYKIDSGEEIIIGRDPSLSHIVIDDGKVSKRHVIIRYDGTIDAYYVTDVSTNGVYLMNGQRLEAGKSTVLQRGTQIRVGHSENIFKLG